MANLNKALLIGNLTKDPELRYTPSGTAVVNITLAINRKYKVKEETKKDVAFIPVVLWSRLAEIVNQYCQKGNPLLVEGRLQTRSWESEGKKQYKTEVVAESIQFMGGKKEDNSKDAGEENVDWLPGEEDA